MIPRHRPPFSVATLAAAAIPGFGSGMTRVEELEHAYAVALDAPYAVWLPSARYGIFQAIRFGVRIEDKVYCPAFTCHVVHQAIRQTARSMSLVDCSVDSPLMDFEGVRSSSGYGVVLSEVFGHRYLKPDANAFLANASLRVFDMAMCIPTARDIQRLDERDIALISFGLGKSLYAGWGGMAFTKDRRMAEWLRRTRHQDIKVESIASRFRAIAGVCLRTVAHTKVLYKLSRRAANSRSESTLALKRNHIPLTAPQKLVSAEWRQSPTRFHLNLADRNLQQSKEFTRDRVQYSQIYRRELQKVASSGNSGDSAWLSFPPDCAEAMSHFCIRVPGFVRDELRTYLWKNGIDTATLFPFPADADSMQSPNAFRLSNEILGLPLSNGLGEHTIRRVCGLIQQFAVTMPNSSAIPSTMSIDRRAA